MLRLYDLLDVPDHGDPMRVEIIQQLAAFVCRQNIPPDSFVDATGVYPRRRRGGSTTTGTAEVDWFRTSGTVTGGHCLGNRYVWDGSANAGYGGTALDGGTTYDLIWTHPLSDIFSSPAGNTDVLCVKKTADVGDVWQIIWLNATADVQVVEDVKINLAGNALVKLVKTIKAIQDGTTTEQTIDDLVDCPSW